MNKKVTVYRMYIIYDADDQVESRGFTHDEEQAKKWVAKMNHFTRTNKLAAGYFYKAFDQDVPIDLSEPEMST